MLCPAGHYCPDWLQKHECEEGTFCILGSRHPKKCPWPSHCPKGTDVRRFYGGIALSVCIDLVLAGLFAWFWCGQRNAAGRSKAPEDSAGGKSAPLLLEDRAASRLGAGSKKDDFEAQRAAHDRLMEGFEDANMQLQI